MSPVEGPKPCSFKHLNLAAEPDSRSAFSARFTALAGESAVQCLSHWHMQLARSHPQSSSEPLSQVAERFGYQSEAAFRRAFKRMFSVSPGSLRGTTDVTALSALRPTN